MKYAYYERKINDIIIKCPIEAGVEILVYNVLDSVIDSNELALIDINRIRLNRDKRLVTKSGVSDIAIVSTDFRYKTKVGNVYGFVEVKATNYSLRKTRQIESQKKKTNHCLYTNGLVWKYYKNGKEEWEIPLAHLDDKKCEFINEFQNVRINEIQFNKLINELKCIDWTK